VLGKTSVKIGCPADVGSIAVFAPTTENVNEAFHGIHLVGAVAVIVGATEGRNFVNPAGFSRHRNSRLTRAVAPNRKRTHSSGTIRCTRKLLKRLGIEAPGEKLVGISGSRYSRLIPEMKRRGVEIRLVIEGQPSPVPRPDPALFKAIARGHRLVL
jgi:hypothetical protein